MRMSRFGPGDQEIHNLHQDHHQHIVRPNRQKGPKRREQDCARAAAHQARLQYQLSRPNMIKLNQLLSNFPSV